MGEVNDAQRKLVRLGVIIFLLTFLEGFRMIIIIAKKTDNAPELPVSRVGHVAGLFCGLWAFAVAGTLQYLNLSPRLLNWLTVSTQLYLAMAFTGAVFQSFAGHNAVGWEAHNFNNDFSLIWGVALVPVSIVGNLINLWGTFSLSTQAKITGFFGKKSNSGSKTINNKNKAN